jgi:hypothetical protein
VLDICCILVKSSVDISPNLLKSGKGTVLVVGTAVLEEGADDEDEVLAKAIISSSVILSFLPLPLTFARSIFSLRANLRIYGAAYTVCPRVELEVTGVAIFSASSLSLTPKY